MRLRAVLESRGCVVTNYSGPGVEVACPRGFDPWGADSVIGCGLVVDPRSIHFFPLGSDKPAEILRHPSSYGSGPGFDRSNWLHATYILGEAYAPQEVSHASR